MNPIKIYWEEYADEGTQLKEVVHRQMSNQPDKFLNSTEVTIQPKVHRKTQSIIASTKKKSNDQKILTSFPEPNVTSSNKKASLKDLSAEEKQKIAKLVHELAKFNSEKEAAVKELEKVKSQYNASLKKIRGEKEQAVKKHDRLKEKLLEYEILIDEIKQASKFVNQPVIEIPIEKDQSKKNEFENDDKQQQQQPENQFFHDFSDLFLEQEKKFRLQQEQLQKQIEQVQKLQGSLIQHHSSQQKQKPEDENETVISEVGENTKKLESYIHSEQFSKISPELTPYKDSSVVLPEVTPHKTPHKDSHFKVKDKVTYPIELDNHDNLNVCNSRSSRTVKKPPTPAINESSEDRSVPTMTSEKARVPEIHSDFLYTPVKKSQDQQYVLVSPVQRKHFQPSSIIDLVDGLQPCSTSTSLDQYSLRRNATQKKITERQSMLESAYATKLSKTHNKPQLREEADSLTSLDQYSLQRNATQKKVTEGQSMLESAYATKLSKSHNKPQLREEADSLEKDILDDIFFI